MNGWGIYAKQLTNLIGIKLSASASAHIIIIITCSYNLQFCVFFRIHGDSVLFFRIVTNDLNARIMMENLVQFVECKTYG